MRPGLLADPRAVFIKGDVANPVNLVLDGPVSAVELQQKIGRAHV